MVTIDIDHEKKHPQFAAGNENVAGHDQLEARDRCRLKS